MINTVLMSIEQIGQIASAIGTFITLAVIGIYALSKKLKSSKNEKLQKLGAKAEIFASALLKIKDFALTCITEAEAFTNYKSEEKKAYVVTRIKEFCITNGFPIDEEVISNLIEELVAFSKNVNVAVK